jgi:hypothetical protein
MADEAPPDSDDPRGRGSEYRYGLIGRKLGEALEIARQAHDEQIMANLRIELDELTKRPGAHILTHDNVLALLRTLKKALSPAFHQAVGEAGPDQTLVIDHPSMALLEELIDAVSDLENGKTHSALKPESYAANASLTTRERKWDDELLDAVIVVQRSKGFKTRKEAEKFLVERLNQAGKGAADSHTRRKCLNGCETSA